MTDASEWRGRVGDTWAAEWRRTERAFAGIGAALDATIADLAPASGRGRALDLGCGVGSTARALAAVRPDMAVVGADLSAPLLAVARELSAGIANLAFVDGDAAAVAAERAPLDLIVSRHGVMFFPDPAAAFAGLNAAAGRHAPLVFTCFRGRDRNDWSGAIEAALDIPPPAVAGNVPGPYAFADDARTGALLAAAGWQDAQARALDVAWQVGGGADPVADALTFFERIGTVARVLAEVPPARRERLRDRLRALFAGRSRDGAVTFTAAIWLWTARAGRKDRP